LDPTKIPLSTTTHDLDDDDITVPTSNMSQRSTTTTSYCACALEHLLRQEVAGGVFQLPTKHAITDSGATHIFVMEGTPVRNKRPMARPLKVALADGHIVTSTYMFDITINGLPVMLIGHIIPDLSIASLFGIRVLTEAGAMLRLQEMNVSWNIVVKLFYGVQRIPRQIYGSCHLGPRT
jgi:hypothetical protein